MDLVWLGGLAAFFALCGLLLNPIERLRGDS